MVKISEHQIQKAFFQWAFLQRHIFPELELMFAIPNGGHRHKLTAYKLKAEGVKAGVPDLFLPVARGRYHGLFIEMKTDKGSLAKNQKEWIAHLIGEGFSCQVCHGVEEAIAAVTTYLTSKEV